MPRRNTDHIIAREGGAIMECLHCGAVEHVSLPMRIEVWVLNSRLFIRAHRNCKKAETEQQKVKE